jgi:phage gp16-like protein
MTAAAQTPGATRQLPSASPLSKGGLNQASGYHAAAMRAVFAACKANGIDEDMRHDIVCAITGKASLKDCTSAEIGKVLDRLNGRNSATHRHSREGGNPASNKGDGGEGWRFVFSAAPSRQPLLKKIYRQAESLGKIQEPPVKAMSKAYVEGIAKQMTGCDTRLEFCDEAMLMKIVAALDFHKRRSCRRQAGA